MLKVGIEGPCCAGKTTLGHSLAQELSRLKIGYVKDYSDYVGGGKFLPPPLPSSIREEEKSLEIFLEIEDIRVRDIRSRQSDLQIALIDRSIHCLLAHCRGLENIKGMGYGYLASARKIIERSSIPVWPNFMLYLDVSDNIIRTRNKGKFEPDSIYMDACFNEGIRSYYHELACLGCNTIIWLDASCDPTMLCEDAKTSIMRQLDPT